MFQINKFIRFNLPEILCFTIIIIYKLLWTLEKSSYDICGSTKPTETDIFLINRI